MRRPFVCFSTLRDSPVRELSLTASLLTSKSRPSAATRSPVSSIKISPGTTRADGRERLSPARMTLASGEDSSFKLSRDFSALRCCTVPRAAFKSNTAKITIALSGSPVSMDTAAAAIKMITSKSLNWLKNTCHHCSRPCSVSTFSPYSVSLFFASLSLIPCLQDPSFFSTSVSDNSNQSAIPAPLFKVNLSDRYKNAPGNVLHLREHSIRVPILIYEGLFIIMLNLALWP